MWTSSEEALAGAACGCSGPSSKTEQSTHPDTQNEQQQPPPHTLHVSQPLMCRERGEGTQESGVVGGQVAGQTNHHGFVDLRQLWKVFMRSMQPARAHATNLTATSVQVDPNTRTTTRRRTQTRGSSCTAVESSDSAGVRRSATGAARGGDSHGHATRQACSTTREKGGVHFPRE